jgi:hypothetical protein
MPPPHGGGICFALSPLFVRSPTLLVCSSLLFVFVPPPSLVFALNLCAAKPPDTFRTPYRAHPFPCAQRFRLCLSLPYSLSFPAASKGKGPGVSPGPLPCAFCRRISKHSPPAAHNPAAKETAAAESDTRSPRSTPGTHSKAARSRSYADTRTDPPAAPVSPE